MSISKENIFNLLLSSDLSSKLKDDSLTKSMIGSIEIDNGVVIVTITYGYPLGSRISSIKKIIQMYFSSIDSAMNIQLNINVSIVAHGVQAGNQLIPGVKNIIAVASGKGGVGKSTTTVNIALALSSQGANVGILDADIYGPSIPLMLGIEGKPESPDGKKILPMLGHGIQSNSIGFLIPRDEAMVWRGPMVTQALEQLLRQTAWDNLDYLLVDLPPGTGDIHLSLAQKVPLTGAIIVTTPQELATLDARKGLKMFQKVSVPILGLVENMSAYVCPNCSHVENIFGKGGGKNLCNQYQIDFLGSLPLNKKIREDSDSGIPNLVSDSKSASAELYNHIAIKVSKKIANMNEDHTNKFPKITIKKS